MGKKKPQKDKRVKCPKCGKYYTIGEWVFCPHGKMGTYGFTVQGGTGKFHK